MNQLSTEIYKVDFKEIINNSLDRSYWKKTWNIFEYDGYKITIELSYIDITSLKVGVKVKLHYVLDDVKETETTYLYLPIEQYNETVFRNKLRSDVTFIIERAERNICRNTEEYMEAFDRDLEIDEENKQELIDFLDDEGVTDSGIREAYINENLSYSNTRIEVVRKAEHNLLLHVHNMAEQLIQFKEREGNND